MLSIQNNTAPIDIGVLEVSSQNKAVLGFFFESSGAELFNEVSIDQASAFIIDFDFPGAIESWEEISLTTQKPGIVLSVNEIIMPNTIWVKKPLTAALLTEAGLKIQEMLGSKNDQVVSSPSLELELEVTAVSDQKNVASHNEIKATMPVIDIPVETPALVTEEIMTASPALAASAASAIGAFAVAPVEEPHDVATITDNQSEIEEDDDLDDLDSLINSLSTKSLVPQDIEPIDTHIIEDDSLARAHTALKEPKLEIENLLSAENNSNIGFITDSEDTVTKEIIPTEKETDSEFFDELILETSPEETAEVEEIREDIITTPAQTTAIDESIEEASSLVTSSQNEMDEVATNEDISDADDDLQAMLDEIQQEMGDPTGAPNSKTGGLTSTRNSSEQQEYTTTDAQERWALLCGDKNRTKSTSEIKKDAFKLNEHLLSNLLDTIEEAKITQQVMRIKYEELLIVIDTEIDTIYTDTSIYSDEYAKACFDPVEKDLLKVHSLDSSETRMMHKKIETGPNNAYTIESFIWTTSLLTSRGRLLEHTNTNKVIGLKYWPNLTRIESFPHIMQIAAVFSKHPGNLIDVSKWLNIPQCYVFAFYNAAFSLNMIDLNTDVVNKNNIKKVSFSFGKKGKSVNRGLFSRLLNKIKG